MIAALLPVLIPLLGQLPGDTSALVNWISSLKTTLSQTGEWTPEAEAAFQALLLKQAAAPEEQPDAPTTPPIQPPTGTPPQPS